jgi:hypothetical protein
MWSDGSPVVVEFRLRMETGLTSFLYL